MRERDLNTWVGYPLYVSLQTGRQVSDETNQHFLAPCPVSRVARFREFSDGSVERQIDEEGILQMATEQGRQSGSLLTSLHWAWSERRILPACSVRWVLHLSDYHDVVLRPNPKLE